LTNPNGTPAAATATDVTITKGIDVASPKLFGAAAAGTTFFIASIAAEKTGNEPFNFATLNLLAPRIVSINQVANTTNGFDEKITVRASVIQLVYTVQKPDGTGGTPITSCWNLTTHAAC
jgi:type VI protein secretion system component Hcp